MLSKPQRVKSKDSAIVTFPTQIAFEGFPFNSHNIQTLHHTWRSVFMRDNVTQLFFSVFFKPTNYLTETAAYTSIVLKLPNMRRYKWMELDNLLISYTIVV